MGSRAKRMEAEIFTASPLCLPERMLGSWLDCDDEGKGFSMEKKSKSGKWEKKMKSLDRGPTGAGSRGEMETERLRLCGSLGRERQAKNIFRLLFFQCVIS